MRTAGFKRSFLGLVAFALFCVTPLSPHVLAEPEVTQGTPKAAPAPEKSFKSPMIMKTRLAAALPENLGHHISSAEFESYLCDNVRLKLLETYVLIGKKSVDISVFVRTYTELGIDKKVDIRVELLGQEIVLATGMLGPFQSEEGKHGFRRITLRVPVDQWPTADVPSIRMTMNVVDDP